MGVCTKVRKGVTAAVLMATPCTNSLGGSSNRISVALLKLCQQSRSNSTHHTRVVFVCEWSCLLFTERFPMAVRNSHLRASCTNAGVVTQ